MLPTTIVDDVSTIALVVLIAKLSRTSLSPSAPQDLRDYGRLYLIWCNRQPLELFEEESFLDSLETRDRELILALKCLALPFAPETNPAENARKTHSMADMSHRLVMEKIAQGEVQLSSLQTLCLLSMVDFTGLWHWSSASEDES